MNVFSIAKNKGYKVSIEGRPSVLEMLAYITI